MLAGGAVDFGEGFGAGVQALARHAAVESRGGAGVDEERAVGRDLFAGGDGFAGGHGVGATEVEFTDRHGGDHGFGFDSAAQEVASGAFGRAVFVGGAIGRE